jgi:FixJ family two-component response regulator
MDGMNRDKIRLALVDDNESVRISFQTMLEFAGYDVEAYPDAESFLYGQPFSAGRDSLDSSPETSNGKTSPASADRGPDCAFPASARRERGSDAPIDGAVQAQCACLIVDWKLPGMSGVELARRIRDDGSDMPVLVISGIQRSEIDESTDNLANTLYLTKPIMPADFLSLVAKIVNCGSASSSITEHN